MDKVWMRKFDGGEPQEIDATPEVLVPLMNSGWRQCEPPEKEVTDGHDR